MDNEMNVWVERLGMTVEEMEGMDGGELQELQDEWTYLRGRVHRGQSPHIGWLRDRGAHRHARRLGR